MTSALQKTAGSEFIDDGPNPGTWAHVLPHHSVSCGLLARHIQTIERLAIPAEPLARPALR
jgi:hypothetical protein